ncbi:MAG: UDP-N-acetylmuramoyl-tripeptide--D-alanyl-D-alanine ligase [Alphaproteobacteria bacterium]|nr:UDP-N-acetylmuramoyl-tripeptide--D-alanyl-D-alanine ligase [Alphaproteobacteria bacterium]
MDEVRVALKSLIQDDKSVKADLNELSGISIDSRTINPGEIFFAIQGDVTDGHFYIAQAVEKEAGLIVVEESKKSQVQGQLGQCAYISVTDTLKAMEAVGQAMREKTRARIIGITGSVGKTSVRTALEVLLSRQGKTTASQKSFNNHWGVPYSLCHLKADDAYGVFEIGMNAPGEIRCLTQQIKPDVALITVIGEAHIGNLGSIEAIAEAKSEIFDGLNQSHGIAVINADSPCFDIMHQRAQEAGAQKIITFGKSGYANVRLVSQVMEGDGRDVTVDVMGQIVTLHLRMIGFQWVENALAIMATIAAVGADIHQAAQDFSRVGLLDGRGKVHHLSLRFGGTFTLIDDSYNANPTSVRSALDTIAQVNGRRIVAFADMLELGDQARGIHIGLAPKVMEAGVDKFFACGPLMGALYSYLPANIQGAWKANSGQLLEPLTQEIRSGDVLLIKGSNSMKMTLLMEQICAFYLDQKVQSA